MSMDNSTLGASRIDQLLGRVSNIHFIGAMGAGMRPLVELMRDFGYTVSGSDIRLQGSVPEGVHIYEGEDVEWISGTEMVVYSLAIDRNSPELCRACELGIPLVSRAELLGAIMLRYKNRIGVSGTHGKSTTVAMLGSVFTAAGCEPTVICGAEMAEGYLRKGGNEWLIYEACEYKDSFLCFSPTSAVITGIELDHTDYFADYTTLSRSFQRSVSRVSGTVVVSDDGSCDGVSGACGASVVSFGNRQGTDYGFEILSLREDRMELRITCRGRELCLTEMSAVGFANARNAAAAAALSHSLGISAEAIGRGLREFPGIHRRLTRLGNIGGRPVYYDYAHHPTEIAVTINTLHSIHGRCTVLFCPHTYSRTQALFSDFVAALSMADYTVVTDIWAAREAPIEGVSAQALAERLSRGVYMPKSEATAEVLANAEGAIVLMGAGEVDIILSEFKAMLD